MLSECVMYSQQVLSVLWAQWTLEVQQFLVVLEHHGAPPFLVCHVPLSLQHLQKLQDFPLR